MTVKLFFILFLTIAFTNQNLLHLNINNETIPYITSRNHVSRHTRYLANEDDEGVAELDAADEDEPVEVEDEVLDEPVEELDDEAEL